MQTQYKEKVDLLNERMAMKANTNVLLTEACDKTRDTEREIIRAKAALEELKEKIAQKMSKLEKEKEEWDEKVKVLKYTSQFYRYSAKNEITLEIILDIVFCFLICN